jgi:hypothetical protein
MSSDESATENEIHVVYRMKIMPWRRDLEREMGILDSQRYVDADIFMPRGSKPVRRIQGTGNRSSTRSAVSHLPQAFYDEGWLEKQPQKFKGEVSMEDFPWYKILGYNHTRN